MSDVKISSGAVPQKFAEWLLTMGCPADKVPSVDKLSQICRGQYYMVWRDLMEKVRPKDVIKKQRLQVFCDDVMQCKVANVFSEGNSKVIVPEELKLSQDQTELINKEKESENSVAEHRQKLEQIMDKITNKLAERNLLKQRVKDLQRRVWFLQNFAEQQKNYKTNLQETKNIANSLCVAVEEDDTKTKLDKYITQLRRSNSQPSNNNASMSMLSVPLASSSIASASGDHHDNEELTSCLMRCPADLLWTELCDRRAALVSALSTHNKKRTNQKHRLSPKSVVSETRALHCNIGLDAMVNRVHLRQARKKLLTAVDDLELASLTSEARELIVLRCEQADIEARVKSLRQSLEQVTTRTGVFATKDNINPLDLTKQILVLDKSITCKKDDLHRLIESLAVIERKILNIRECLINVFHGFHKDEPVSEYDRFRGLQIDLPQESIRSIRQFYEESRNKRHNQIELSFNIDTSGSYDSDLDMSNLKFIDELKLYLNKFSLEYNRKLVLESGEKIWIFETYQSALHQLYGEWMSSNMSCTVVCPSVSLSHNLMQLMTLVKVREEKEALVKMLEAEDKKYTINLDISSSKEQEERVMDKVKKCLHENILNLRKVMKSLEHSQQNLTFWSDNLLRKFISTRRTVDGQTYKECEIMHLENCN